MIEHHDVLEVAVVGVDHPTLGQEIKAYVVPREPGAVSEDDLRAFAAEALAGYKVPTYVEFLDALPHNATGKVLKHLLGKDVAPGAAGFVEEPDGR